MEGQIEHRARDRHGLDGHVHENIDQATQRDVHQDLAAQHQQGLLLVGEFRGWLLLLLLLLVLLLLLLLLCL
jgi:hypothetical protein